MILLPASLLALLTPAVADVAANPASSRITYESHPLLKKKTHGALRGGKVDDAVAEASGEDGERDSGEREGRVEIQWDLGISIWREKHPQITMWIFSGLGNGKSESTLNWFDSTR